MSHRFVLRATSLDNSVVEHSFDATSLPEVLEGVEKFLRGVGFVFDGELDTVQEDVVLTSTAETAPILLDLDGGGPSLLFPDEASSPWERGE